MLIQLTTRNPHPVIPSHELAWAALRRIGVLRWDWDGGL